MVGTGIEHSRRIASPYAVGIGCVAILCAGCAQSPSGWRRSPAPATTGQVDELSAASVAGRVARIDAVANRAASFNRAEADRHAQSLADSLSSDSATPVKMAAVRCLGKLSSPAAVDVLGLALRDSDADVRAEACRALGRIDSPDALQLLADALSQERDVDAKLAAVRGLGHFKDPRAVHALGSALEDRDPAVQYVAMQSLKNCTGEDLGDDVRRWRELSANPTDLLAGRDSNPGRL